MMFLDPKNVDYMSRISTFGQGIFECFESKPFGFVLFFFHETKNSSCEKINASTTIKKKNILKAK